LAEYFDETVEGVKKLKILDRSLLGALIPLISKIPLKSAEASVVELCKL
jgi:hypothetical protein